MPLDLCSTSLTQCFQHQQHQAKEPGLLPGEGTHAAFRLMFILSLQYLRPRGPNQPTPWQPGGPRKTPGREENRINEGTESAQDFSIPSPQGHD